MKLDADVSTGYGRRVTNWELKGVPVRIDVGPRELAEGNVTLVRRDTGEKTPVALGDLVATVARTLDSIQADMLTTAETWRDSRTTDVATLETVIEASQDGFARIPFAAIGEDGEDELAKHGITIRCIQRPDGSVPATEDEPDLVAIAAKAY